MNAVAIDRKIKRLSSKWWGGRKWYQYIEFDGGVNTGAYAPAKAQIRTQTYSNFLESFELKQDDKIMDIGCNAGLFSLICAQRVSHVIGVELDKAFLKQAEFVKTQWENSGKATDNVDFYLGSIIDKLDLLSDRTIVMASKVLYHKGLGGDQDKLMRAISESPVRAILLQGHTVQGDLGRNDGMEELMAEYGFKYERIYEHEEYPVSLGYR